ncbi:MAG: carboxypeptidase regulatory-like domain-containing protein, partial [Terriglobus sp.]
ALVSYDSARANFGTGPSPERPDLVAGRSSNPIKGGPVQYFDPTAFSLPAAGYYGNLGRNTLIGPGLISIDTALAKNFRFSDRARLQLRAEVFNLPNRPNFGIPSQRNVFTTTGRVASAGTITTTTSPSRQIQLGARFDF